MTITTNTYNYEYEFHRTDIPDRPLRAEGVYRNHEHHPMSANIMEVNRRLIERNVHPHYRSLSGYFRWSFRNDRFTLWQRAEYNSDVCFGHKIMEIHFVALVCEDRVKANTISN